MVERYVRLGRVEVGVSIGGGFAGAIGLHYEGRSSVSLWLGVPKGQRQWGRMDDCPGVRSWGLGPLALLVRAWL